MKLPALSLSLVLAAACGGTSKSPDTTATAPKGGVPAPWGAVLVEGATFTLDNNTPEMPSEDPLTVIATIHDVKTDGDRTRATIAWTFGDGSEGAAGLLPTTVQVSPAGVWFANVNDDDADAVLAGPPTFPAGAEKTHRDGSYDTATPGEGGAVCYGWEPDENAGECEDVCFASVCVAPDRGIVSGEGNWWPNAEMYHQVAK